MPETTGLVAWEDLRVGETYWGVVPGWQWLPTKYTFVDKHPGNFGDECFRDECGSWLHKDNFADALDSLEETNIPMIYATCADACRAMIARLEQFMAEQGGGNG